MNEMTNNNRLYYVIVGALIVSFNISPYLNVKAKTPLSITIVILVSLLALILFRNKIKVLGEHKLLAAGLVIMGVILTLSNHKLAFFYAACGVISLTLVQFSIMSRSKGFILIGGKPTEKLNAKERKIALFGLATILSVALTFFTQVLILKASI